MMKHAVAGTGILLLVLMMAACPVSAFTAKTLDISIQDNTDAVVTFDYELSWYENIVVFARIVDPAAELAQAFRSESSKNVVVTGVNGNQAQIRIEKFASRKASDGVESLNSPSLTFTKARQALDKYWFARFVSPDFSPEVTRVRLPDGYTETFYNVEEIPSVRHVTGTA